MYNKSTYTVHYLIDGPTDTHTHTHPKNRTKWSLIGPPAQRTVGLKTRVCLGPVHLVWSSRRPGDQREASRTQAPVSASCGVDGVSRALDRRRRRRRKKMTTTTTKTSQTDSSCEDPLLLFILSSTLAQAWIILGRGSTFSTLGTLPSESVGGGITFPLVSAQGMPGADGFSSLFSAEP